MTLILSGTNGVSDVDGSASTPAIRGSDSNTGIFFPAADTIAFAEGGAEVARFDSSGNFGIGTSSPSTYANGAAPTLVVGTGNNWVVAQPRTDGPSGAANGVRLAGNYSTNPKPGSAIWIGAQGSAGQRGMIGFFTKDTDDNTNEPTERARITSGGTFLVGTTNETGDGGGNEIRPNAENGGLIVVKKTSSSVSGNVFVLFARDGSTRGSIALNGTTAVSYNTTSDYRLKENIAPMTGALSKVALLKPCTYTWKADGAPGQGFIAHELAEVVPDAVTGDKDAVDENGKIKPQAIDTSFLVATLTAAIQELKAELDTAKARIAALEAA